MKHQYPNDKTISFRVSDKRHEQLTRKAAKFGGTSALLREFIDAFIEDRLTITQTTDKEKLYVNRSKD